MCYYPYPTCIALTLTFIPKPFKYNLQPLWYVITDITDITCITMFTPITCMQWFIVTTISVHYGIYAHYMQWLHYDDYTQYGDNTHFTYYYGDYIWRAISDCRVNSN